MIKELTIKELAPYLPYGLNVWNTTDEFPYKLLALEENNCTLESGDIPFYRCKPILRPFSDLTKEIEVNGEKFVPMEYFEKNINKTIFFYKPLNNDLPLEISIQTQDYSQSIDLFNGYLCVQKFCEWHIDFQGLIDAGLAVDINTI